MRRFCGKQRVSIRPNQLLRYNVFPTEKCKHDMWTHENSFILKSTYIQIYIKIKYKILFFSCLPENIYINYYFIPLFNEWYYSVAKTSMSVKSWTYVLRWNKAPQFACAICGNFDFHFKSKSLCVISHYIYRLKMGNKISWYPATKGVGAMRTPFLQFRLRQKCSHNL